MSEQEFYLQEKSEKIAASERRYDSFVANETCEKQKNSSFFLQKMKEIIFCRNKGLPTKQKEKDLRAYRDADVLNK